MSALLCPSCFQPKGESDPSLGLCAECSAALAAELRAAPPAPTPNHDDFDLGGEGG